MSMPWSPVSIRTLTANGIGALLDGWANRDTDIGAFSR